jgi:hypothetical protein
MQDSSSPIFLSAITIYSRNPCAPHKKRLKQTATPTRHAHFFKFPAGILSGQKSIATNVCLQKCQSANVKCFIKRSPIKSAVSVQLHLIVRRVTRDRCYDFKNIFAEKFGKNIGVFESKQSKIMQNYAKL